MRRAGWLLAGTLVVCAGCRAPRRALRPGAVALGVGASDVGIMQQDSLPAPAAMLEYRAAHVWHRLAPVAGIQANGQGGVYGYGGVRYDIPVGRGFEVTPSLCAGGYRAGNGTNLGNVFELRSAIEVSYRLTKRSRIGVQAQHVSNARIGDGGNPGSENVFLTYSRDLGKR